MSLPSDYNTEKDNVLQREINSLAVELSNRYEELNLIYRVGDKLTAAEDLPGTIKDIIQDASNILWGDTIILSVPDKGIFEYVLDDDKYTYHDLFHILEKIDNKYSFGKTHIVVNNLAEFKSYGFRNRDRFKFIATSVRIKDEHKGILTVLNDSQKRDYSTSDLKLLTVLAGQLSIIITNNELYQSLKDFLLNLVKSMVSAIEAKDSYTRGHSERVNKISMVIAKTMGLSDKDVENTSWAAILHDIGKIGIPENVLTKPDRLTEGEYAIIMTHPRKGYEILEPIVQLKDALQGVLYHQEKYDGRGYPEGLKGEAIPLYARIIALADMYDAITSSRAYRERNTHTNAMKEIERVSGSQLDPMIVEIFKKVCDGHPDFMRGEQKQDEDKKN